MLYMEHKQEKSRSFSTQNIAQIGSIFDFSEKILQVVQNNKIVDSVICISTSKYIEKSDVLGFRFFADSITVAKIEKRCKKSHFVLDAEDRALSVPDTFHIHNSKVVVNSIISIDSLVSALANGTPTGRKTMGCRTYKIDQLKIVISAENVLLDIDGKHNRLFFVAISCR